MTQPIIKLTDAAMTHVDKIIARQNKGKCLYISVKKMGCTGFTYVMDIVQEPKKTSDLTFQQNHLTIYIDNEAVKFIEGTTIDFVSKGLGREEWTFNNPQVESTCGCGESFNIKEQRDAV